MPREAAIIGDYFMLPEVFAEKIAAVCGDAVNVRTRKDNWPDEPMEHGYAGSKLDGLKEFMGQPDDIVAFIDEAELLVTHLAPISRSMLERLPKLKFIAVSRGGPVNIDMQAARDHDVMRRQNGNRTPACATRSENDAAGFRHQGVSFGDPGVALLQVGDGKRNVGKKDGQRDRGASRIDEFAAVASNAPPTFRGRDLCELGRERCDLGKKLKIRVQPFGLSPKKGRAFFK